MIGRLRGILIEKQAPLLLIDVNGVFYEVHAPMSTFYHLPELENPVTLHTHMVVREDAQLLYGFYSQRERALFRSLIRVNGVGPKLALTILSGVEPDQFVQCIHADDATSLTKIPGIGKKTAERLIIETRDALKEWEPTHSHSNATGELFADQATNDAIAALTSLGYKPNDAKRAIGQIQEDGLTSEELIRLALKKIVRGV